MPRCPGVEARRAGVDGKIGLEEHFATEDTIGDSERFLPTRLWAQTRAGLIDFHDRLLGEMDANGIAMMLMSLNAPAVQAIPDVNRAIAVARAANDALAAHVARSPKR